MHVFQRLCPPLIETPRLRLRTFTQNDIVTLHAAVKESSCELQPFLPWCHPEYSLTDAEDWIRFTQETWTQRRQFAFAVECKHSGRFVGGCGLDSPSTGGTANLGYWIRTPEARQGYATEAARHLANTGLQVLGLASVELVMSVRNTASQQVAIRCGAEYLGLDKNELTLHGQTEAAHTYVIRHPKIDDRV